MVIIRINKQSIKVPAGYRLLKDDVRMVANDKILNVLKGTWEDVTVRTSGTEIPDVMHTPMELTYAAVIRHAGFLNKEDFKEDGLYVEDETSYGFKRIEPDAAFIQEQLNNIVDNMNREVVYPKDRINELQWNDVFNCWMFPRLTPKSEGRYLSLLLVRLEEEFPNAIFEQAVIKKTSMDKEVKYVKKYVHTIQMSCPESYTIEATSEIYEPPYKKIVLVGISLKLKKKRKDRTVAQKG